MTWIVIIDNGGQYSAHCHWTAYGCQDEDAAKDAVHVFTEWRDAGAALLAHGPGEWAPGAARWAAYAAWHAAHPCPLGKNRDLDNDWEYTDPRPYTATAVQVPEWSRE